MTSVVLTVQGGVRNKEEAGPCAVTTHLLHLPEPTLVLTNFGIVEM